MASGLAQKLSNLRGGISNALFGVQPMQVVQGNQYPIELQEYLDNDFENQQFVKDLMNKPAQERMSLDQIKEGFTQGLNFGNQQMADEQKRLKINLPKTGDEIDLAKTGQFNTYPTQSTIVAQPRQGGFFNDFSKGYNDNYYNNFDPNNLTPQQNKGFAVRLGEGLGTLGRFVDSPLGRGLLAAGLNSALGYDNSLQEGLTAYVGRQNNQTTDKLYRNQLKNNYGFTDEDLDNIKGNIDSTLFNNLTKSQTSAMNLALKQQTTQSMNRLRELQIEKQKILNSTLPQEQKAKLIKLNAEAAHAEEMQIARINYYQNATANPLGWANYNLNKEKFEESKNNPKETNVKNMPDYGKNLSYYVSMPTKTKEDREKKAQARADFIAEYKVDPEKQLGDNY